MPAPASLLRRAAACRPAGDALRPALWIEAGEALTQAGELEAADEVLGGVTRRPWSCCDEALEATASLGLIYLHRPDRLGRRWWSGSPRMPSPCWSAMRTTSHYPKHGAWSRLCTV